MDALLEGYRRFRADVWPTERSRYQELSIEGQSPETLVIACSDSRVDPQTIFGAVPGELFVVRNVAALVPPYEPDARYHGTSAAIEFAVRVLKVKRIVVLGHAQCGGVQALLEGAPEEAGDFVRPWLQIAEPVKAQISSDLPRDERLLYGEEAAVRLSIENLKTIPWIAEAVEAGRLTLEGYRFGIRTGVLTRLAGDHFEPVV
jgi:carbonic anhydrase